MQLKNYKYIKNQKPKFDTGDDQNQRLFDPGYNYIGFDPINNVQYFPKSQVDGNMGKAISDFKAPSIKPAPTGNSFSFPKGNIGSSITSAASFMGDVFSNFNTPIQSSNQLMQQAGTSQNAINGVQYDQYNSIDADQAQSELSAQNKAQTAKTALSGLSTGASIGSSFGPIGAGVGAVIGGAFGGILGSAAAKRRREALKRNIFNAQQSINRKNVFNRSSAQSDALSQGYLQKYGNTQDDVLYANRGKDKMRYNRGKVWSPEGYETGEHNSYVGKGESIINFSTGKGSLVNKGKIGVDNQPSSVQENDDNVILGNDIDWSNGNTFAQQAAPYTNYIQSVNKNRDKVGKYNKLSSLSKQTKDLYNKQTQGGYQQALGKLKELADKQEYQHNVENNMEQYPQYAKGKSNWFSKYGDDIQTILPSAIGMIEGLSRYNNTKNQDIEKSNTYFANPYQSKALNGLANLRYNIYPQLREYRDQLRQSKYAMLQNGGLTAGQKYAANSSMYDNYINNVAKLYAAADAQNNQYKAAYYDALMKAGDADRNALTAAKRYDDEVYAKAHAARQTASNQALKDLMENVYRLDKRYVDNKRWKDTLGIYQNDMDIKQKDILSRFPQSKKQTYTFLPTDAYRYTNAPSMMDYINDYNPYANKFKFLGR